MDAWKTHQKLFNSIVASTTLYGSHIWAPNYKDVIEKVQSHFIRRLLHLDFKTPTYALRLETKTQKLILTVRKQQINFVIRLLQMPASRLSNISFRALKLTAGSEKRKYNWLTELHEELKTLNLRFLCTSVDEMDWIRWKSIILTSLESTLNQEDMARARDSRHHQYCANILEGHHVKDIIPIIGLSKARMIGQTRLNVGKFYWKGESFCLSNTERCSFCNCDAIEDVYHLTLECLIHRSSQTRFCHHLQLQQGIDRENLANKIMSMPTSELKELAVYIITALKRRKLFIQLSDF
jgi:hypothetical protein